MNPVFSEVLNGVMVSVVSELVTKVTEKVWSGLIRIGSGSDHEMAPLDAAIKDAVGSATRDIPVQGEAKANVTKFLLLPETQNLLRQVFSSQFSARTSHLEAIEREFSLLFSLHVSLPAEQMATIAHDVFQYVVDSCEETTRKLIDKGIITGLEMSAAARHHLVMGELSNIQKNIQLLKDNSVDINSILKFEQQYREQVKERHSNIKPPTYDNVRRIPIDDIYVTPNFVKVSARKSDMPMRIDIDQFFRELHRTVVLGSPGGGKSTLSQKLCYELSARYDEQPLIGRQVTPMLVVLREYGVEKKLRNCSILQFLESKATSNYQVSPPRGAFEYLLLNGRSLVVFDGLDELLDMSYRQEIAEDIESFCNLYPSVPVLITSRKVGYEQAPLNVDKFKVYNLDDFDEFQAKEYIKKWFALDTELSPEQQRHKVEQLATEANSVPDLMRNPLLLALICNIYRGEGYIPKNRPEVYEKCSMMLFERWDRGRNIVADFPFENHLMSTLKFLAFWIYEDTALQNGVTEASLVEKTTEYLCSRRYEDLIEAEVAARQFVALCRGRMWVFTDTGTTSAGEKLYQFTHRTFLEYFAADYLVRTQETPEQLAECLLSRIERREWDVVAQLAFQIMNKRKEDASKRLFDPLLSRCSSVDPKSRWAIISFAVRALEFIVPPPALTRRIANACIVYCISAARERFRDTPPCEMVAELFLDLFGCSGENSKYVANTIRMELERSIRSSDSREARAAIELTLKLKTLARKSDRWDQVAHEILEACAAAIRGRAKKSVGMSAYLFSFGVIPIINVLKWHDANALYSAMVPTYGRLFLRSSPGEQLLSRALRPPKANYTWKEDLAEIGAFFVNNTLPAFTNRVRLSGLSLALIVDERMSEGIDFDYTQLDQDTLFGIFVLLATVLETTAQPADAMIIVNMSRHPLIGLFRSVLTRRFSQGDTSNMGGIELMGRFQPEQHAIIRGWESGEISLTAASARAYRI